MIRHAVFPHAGRSYRLVTEDVYGSATLHVAVREVHPDGDRALAVGSVRDGVLTLSLASRPVWGTGPDGRGGLVEQPLSDEEREALAAAACAAWDSLEVTHRFDDTHAVGHCDDPAAEVEHLPPRLRRDLRGERFGRLTVAKCLGSICGHVYWLCLCECGQWCRVYGGDLKAAKTRSCGCLRAENGRANLGNHAPAVGDME